MAAYDGVVQGMVRGMESLQSLVGSTITNRVLAVGGGARSVAYRQFIADRCAQPVLTVDALEATARGACIQAAAVLHGTSVSAMRDEWTPATTSTIEPRGAEPGVGADFSVLSGEFDHWYFTDR